MYDVTSNELIDADIEMLLDTPVYTDINGNKVNEDEWFGME